MMRHVGRALANRTLELGIHTSSCASSERWNHRAKFEGSSKQARLPPRATNCRKRKCGHTNQLRPKKKLK
ncbi:MAG: hypothetical protein Q9178_004195 [Gyalolechia marmorata]